ncbi:hypothetical protein DB347_14410 [Opitutaceae bacterium EW11]|nr:hypothetical protein DB347_14410 [Opitutaceae bacterium EW11]
MISWIQKTFQQHFRLVFGVLLAVTIISFIFTIGASPGIGRADRRAMARPYFGLNLSNAEDYRRLRGDADLSVYVQVGFMGMDDSRLQSYAYARYACLALADKLGIPAPTQNEIGDYIRNLPRFASENGQFDSRKYNEFRDSLKKNKAVTEADVSRVIADNIRVERVQKLLSGPGYVLPEEVRKQLAMADTTWTIGVASFDYASYNPAITPTDADLQKYFSDNSFRYQIPPQVNASYVEFPATAYVGRVNVSDAEVRAYYDANPARFPKPAAQPEKPGTPPPAANPAADFAVVKPQVEATLKFERAQRLAAKEASDFAVGLYEKRIPFGSAELNSYLSSQNLALKDLPPFSEEQLPAPLAGNPQISEEIFRLNKDRYFTDALSTQTGSVVVFWKSTVPSRQPDISEVRAKVAADYVQNEKMKRFVDLGRTMKAQLAAHLKAGETFDKAVSAVASANGIKGEAKMHPAFTLRQRPQDVDFTALGTLEHLDKGELSEMVRAQGNKGLIVYAADKKQPELSESSEAYVTTRNQIAQYTASQVANEYVRELVDSELAKSTPATQ